MRLHPVSRGCVGDACFLGVTGGPHEGHEGRGRVGKGVVPWLGTLCMFRYLVGVHFVPSR
eukprot:7525617-Heterocapsa_arctica.AAC.1